MRISVIGCGYLGAVHAACLASAGHDVVGIEHDPERAHALQRGAPEIHEPHLEELLREGLAAGRLAFSPRDTAAEGCDVHFVCVGTPQRDDTGASDTRAVHGAIDALAARVRPGQVVVGKSTVPVGTAEEAAARLAERSPGVPLVWNPEFLREGTAVADTLRPERLVYGVDRSGHERTARAVALLDEVYAPQLRAGVPRLVTDLATAQLVKVAANSFLAAKISFINAMAEVCEASGGDVDELADAIGMDERIGRSFLDAGLGFGGGCLPKDVRGFRTRARELGAGGADALLGAVDDINARAALDVVELVRERLGGVLAGHRVCVLGATFKPRSDDVRDAPGLAIAEALRREGARVTVADPLGVRGARRSHPQLRATDDLALALEGAHAVVLATAWPEYLRMDPHWAGEQVARRLLVDGRGAMPTALWQEVGWEVRSIGRRGDRTTDGVLAAGRDRHGHGGMSRIGPGSLNGMADGEDPSDRTWSQVGAPGTRQPA
ncbi:UDP-glucose dehydrogenase family protein [Brachybacterium subflavum]|uniref:UDP-glucose dehydrogenase family protein n=1 Tax=Brachybacterium subflavum TaxID=2585206 RepID=UPI0012666E19|nr:UDP-glucose/GDP-mannose dehydrogenase family protein [Brachybacterium subflavum]